MSAPIDLKAIREARLRRRRKRFSPIGEKRIALPTVSPEALARADFIKFGPQAKRDGGTSCFNCQYRHPGKPLCQYKGEVDLRGLQVYRDTCCAFWDEQGATRPWEGQSVKYNPEDDDGMSWKGSYFEECERDESDRCKPKGGGGEGGKTHPQETIHHLAQATEDKARAIAHESLKQHSRRQRFAFLKAKFGELTQNLKKEARGVAEQRLNAAIGHLENTTGLPAELFSPLKGGLNNAARELTRQYVDDLRNALSPLKDSANKEDVDFYFRDLFAEPDIDRDRIADAFAEQIDGVVWNYTEAELAKLPKNPEEDDSVDEAKVYENADILTDAIRTVIGHAFNPLPESSWLQKFAGGLTRKADTGTKGAGMWITIGGHAEEGKEHVGGVPVLIDGRGNIVGGKVPRSMHGTNVGQFKENIEAHRAPAKPDAAPKSEKPSKITLADRAGNSFQLPADILTQADLLDLGEAYNSRLNDAGRIKLIEMLGLKDDPVYQSKGFQGALRAKLYAHYNPVPIGERIKEAKSLHAKAEKIAAIHAEGEKKWEEFVDQKANLQQQARDLYWMAETARGKKKEQLKRQMQEAEERYKTLKGEQEKVRAEALERIRQLLVLDKHTPVKGHIPDDYDPEDVKRITAAKDWLTGLVAPGHNGEELQEYTIEAVSEGDRASYNDAAHRMRLEMGGEIKTAIHEMGHGIEYKMPGAKSAAMAFLRHRQGNETPQKFRDVLGRGYDNNEIGIKDEFDKAFGKTSGWYCGKIYPDGATELISMGVERLYTDPAGFARADPEYFAFVLGILDGSLRDKPIPEK